jgi:dTMP kinase
MATRLQRAPDRLEQAGDGFHERVRAGYLAMVTADPHRWVVVDGTGTEDEVAAAVAAALGVPA